jgi:hypothetical protein
VAASFTFHSSDLSSEVVKTLVCRIMLNLGGG